MRQLDEIERARLQLAACVGAYMELRAGELDAAKAREAKQ
jgi:hypothetical protein